MRDFRNLAHAAEGKARGGEADLQPLLEIAFGSACDVEGLPVLAGDLGLLREAFKGPIGPENFCGLWT